MAKSVSLERARSLIIQGQLLNKNSKSPLKVLEALGYIQIDTISVVQRAHHHVFWSRLPKYQTSDLARLIEKRDAFEYWAHAAAYLPMKDYRYSLLRKRSFKSDSRTGWWPRDKKVMKYVLDRIKGEGALQSSDFKNQKIIKTGWGEAKSTKRALERLFMEGELEISSRNGFQKVYDLSQRVIPPHINQETPSDIEFADYLIRRTLKNHVFATIDEISYLQVSKIKKIVGIRIEQLIEEKELVEIKVQGVEQIYFSMNKRLSMPKISDNEIHILSPFDNLVIQRNKLTHLFNFNYKIECYLPAAKRKYGYFSLPILAGKDFIARVDCKTNRKNRELKVQSFHWEESRFINKHKDNVIQKLVEFSMFNSCQLNLNNNLK